MAFKRILSNTTIWRRSISSLSNKVVQNRLREKTAVLIESTDGIGLAVARRLSQEGCNVVVSSEKNESVQRVVAKLKNEGLQVHGVACHVSSFDDRKRLFDEAVRQYGGIDILVSNADIKPSNDECLLQCSEQNWDKIFDVNVKASFLLAQEVVPFMRRRDTGSSIVFMASLDAYSPHSAYGISKAAILGLTKAASIELGPQGIRVNCFAPGSTQTDFGRVMFSNEGKDQLKRSLEQIPLGRVGKTEEMAGVVAFLVSDDASYITGETIVVAGGSNSRL